jgi:predicted DNA-binding protein YlxM (UPF0122 family)
MGFSDFDRIFNDYDDSTIKPGMPFTGTEFDAKAFGLEVMAAASKRLRQQFEQMTTKSTDPNKKRFLEFVANDLNHEPLQTWLVRSWRDDPSIFDDETAQKLIDIDDLYNISEDIRRVGLGTGTNFKDVFTNLQRGRTNWLSLSKISEHHILPVEGTKVMDFGDGWGWWNLGKKESPEEGKAMGHCGNTANADDKDVIYSLRKQMGRSYVRPELTFILNGGWLGEMKGRSNQKPVKEYHPYIVELLKQPGINGIFGGGHDPPNNFAISDLNPEQKQGVESAHPEFVGDWRMTSPAIKRDTVLSFPEKWMSGQGGLDLESEDLQILKSKPDQEALSKHVKQRPQLALNFFSDTMTDQQRDDALNQSMKNSPKSTWTNFSSLMTPEQKHRGIEAILVDGEHYWALTNLYEHLSNDQVEKALTYTLPRVDTEGAWNQFHKKFKPAHKKILADAVAKSAEDGNDIFDAEGFFEEADTEAKDKALKSLIKRRPGQLLALNKKKGGKIMTPQMIEAAADRVIVEESSNQVVMALEAIDTMSKAKGTAIIDIAIKRDYASAVLTTVPHLLPKDRLQKMIQEQIRSDPNWAVTKIKSLLTPKQLEEAFDRMDPDDVLEQHGGDLTPEYRVKVLEKVVRVKPRWALKNLTDLSPELKHKAVSTVIDGDPSRFWQHDFIYTNASPEQLDSMMGRLGYDKFVGDYVNISPLLTPAQLKKATTSAYTTLMRHNVTGILDHPEIFDEKRRQHALQSLIEVEEAYAGRALLTTYKSLLTDKQRQEVLGNVVKSEDFEFLFGDYWKEVPEDRRREITASIIKDKPFVAFAYRESLGLTPEQVTDCVTRAATENAEHFNSYHFRNLTDPQKQIVIDIALQKNPRWALRNLPDLSKEQHMVAVASLMELAKLDVDMATWTLGNVRSFLTSEQKQTLVMLVVDESPGWVLDREEFRNLLSPEQVFKAVMGAWKGRDHSFGALWRSFAKLLTPEQKSQFVDAGIEDGNARDYMFEQIMDQLTPTQRQAMAKHMKIVESVKDGYRNLKWALASGLLTEEEKAGLIQWAVERGNVTNLFAEEVFERELTSEQKAAVVARLVGEEPYRAREWYKYKRFGIDKLLTPEQISALGLDPESVGKERKDHIKQIMRDAPLRALTDFIEEMTPEQIKYCIENTYAMRVMRNVWNKLDHEQQQYTIEQAIVEDKDELEASFWDQLSPEQKIKVNETRVSEEANTMIARDPMLALQRAFEAMTPEQIQYAIDQARPHLVLRDVGDKITEDQKRVVIERLVTEDRDRAQAEFWHLLSPEQKQIVDPAKAVAEAANPEAHQASAKCAYCRKPMRLFEDRGVLQCPYCRRELAVEVDRQRFQYDPSRETTGAEVAMGGPSPNEMKFDRQMYQTKVPGDLW